MRRDTLQWHFPCEKVLLARNREQGWSSGENARFSPLWLALDSGQLPYVDWVCCCILPCSEGFSPGPSDFLLPKKTRHSKFQFDQDRGPAWKPAKADVASSLDIGIYFLLIYLFIHLSCETT